MLNTFQQFEIAVAGREKMSNEYCMGKISKRQLKGPFFEIAKCFRDSLMCALSKRLVNPVLNSFALRRLSNEVTLTLSVLPVWFCIAIRNA